MKHFTDPELVQVFYGDVENELEGDRLSHLNQCVSCARRFGEFKKIAGTLSQNRMPTRPLRDLDAAVSTRLAAVMPERQTQRSRRSVVWTALAASILALVASAGFFAGELFRSRSVNQWFQQSMSQQLRQQQAAFEERFARLEHRVVSREDLESIHHQMDQLSVVMVELARRANARESDLAQRIEAVLRQIALEQQTLRQGLQTLAVNAESEITLAKADIARLSQISLRVPSSQQ